MCRKLETEEEKVLPFYASTLTEQEEKEIEAMVQQEPENDLANVRLFICLFRRVACSAKQLAAWNISVRSRELKSMLKIFLMMSTEKSIVQN